MPDPADTRAPGGEPADGRPYGPRLRVVGYNIHGGRGPGLAALVRELAPDVVVAQEGPRRLRWRTRCAGLAASFGLFHTAGGLPALGNVIFTSLRVTPGESWHLRYPLTPGRHLRGAAFARCAVDGVEFVVAGTHLATDDTERPRQAALFEEALAAVDAPLVACADVNETADGPSFRLLAAGRTDAAGSDGTPTFSTVSPRRRIDAVLVDPRCRIEAYRVLDTPPARLASDHFPVVVDLRLPG